MPRHNSSVCLVFRPQAQRLSTKPAARTPQSSRRSRFVFFVSMRFCSFSVCFRHYTIFFAIRKAGGFSFQRLMFTFCLYFIQTGFSFFLYNGFTNCEKMEVSPYGEYKPGSKAEADPQARCCRDCRGVAGAAVRRTVCPAAGAAQRNRPELLKCQNRFRDRRLHSDRGIRHRHPGQRGCGRPFRPLYRQGGRDLCGAGR